MAGRLHPELRRWRHALDRQLELDPARKAVLTLLMLRGAQTPGELRGRSDRLHAFTSVDEVESVLEALAQGPEPIVVQLPRGPGQKEARWAHLLAGEIDVAAPPIPERPARVPLPTIASASSRRGFRSWKHASSGSRSNSARNPPGSPPPRDPPTDAPRGEPRGARPEPKGRPNGRPRSR